MIRMVITALFISHAYNMQFSQGTGFSYHTGTPRLPINPAVWWMIS